MTLKEAKAHKMWDELYTLVYYDYSDAYIEAFIWGKCKEYTSLKQVGEMIQYATLLIVDVN